MRSLHEPEYRFNFNPDELTNLMSALNAAAARWPVNAAERAQKLYDRLHGRVSVGVKANDQGLTPEERAA